MSKNYELLTSLKGIGLVVACQLIYHTGNFTRFASWRSFSSYCGTAPFKHESGTSIHRRKQCHYLGDRKMKSLLSMASISAIQHDSELRLYYNRKLAEGKDKMLAINNVRNKLIARAFAVVKRGTPYVVLQRHAA
jgi:transposase